MRYRRAHPVLHTLLPVTGPRFPTLAWPALLLAAWLPTTHAATPPTAGRFSFYGLAPAVAGLDRAKAEAALGQPLQPEPLPAARAASAAAGAAGAAACQHRLSPQQPGVRYTLTGDVITRIETRDTRYATVSGVHVGDTVAQAQKAYGKRLNSAPHPYFAQGKVLTVYSPDRKFALVMEANDQGRIITLRGGRLPEVGWLEGCS
jgi:hypothetical protein